MDLIESLGLSSEEIANRVIDRAVDKLLWEVHACPDEDGESFETTTGTVWAKETQQAIAEKLNQAVDAFAEKHILPQVTKRLDTIVLQKTNEWGEKHGNEEMSFTEYIVDRADKFLKQPVDFEGQPKTPGSSYDKQNQTRLTHLVEKHLHYAIENAMKTAVENINETLGDALTETCKLKLKEITDKLAVSVKV